ncbi:protein-glutamate O-methyltransferase CheR [Asinibacterium sp. OR53]|uniref:CheR family methyltransferase n=1 Tax=Asinibacterium sp. OR53 TaxID=925409 RepID=UPI00047915B4|nr:protein-glutamate O-methyltransferase CheR [Asinibacterium sp. OR53]
MLSKLQITHTEIKTVLDLLYRQYGYDFSNYTKASLRRRLQKLMYDKKTDTGAALIAMLTTNPETFSDLLEVLTVNVTEMFRDPPFFKTLREKVIPVLASYPAIKIWHAGCATGEEVYSTCILLYEAGLLHRSRIYATDINPANVEKAASGILSLSRMKGNTSNYLQSGGIHDFSDYYTAMYDKVIIRKDIRERVVFQQHSLVTDGSFNEFQLIFCRNVMIYFDKALQNNVVKLFYDSLIPLGFLALGMKESLLFSEVQDCFEMFDAGVKIFRKQ